MDEPVDSDGQAQMPTPVILVSICHHILTVLHDPFPCTFLHLKSYNFTFTFFHFKQKPFHLPTFWEPITALNVKDHP